MRYLVITPSDARRLGAIACYLSHAASYILHPTSYTLHPTSYFLQADKELAKTSADLLQALSEGRAAEALLVQVGAF